MIIDSKVLSLLIIAFFILSCSKPELHFDISRQELIECSNFKLNDIYIINDSIDKKGFFIEPQINLKWDNATEAPFSIPINNIPTSYIIYRDKKVIDNFRLMNNTSYTISQGVSGKSIFSIRVWTDDQGIVYKTTHNDCNTTASLDMK
ncbi:MAG: hypothetical protein K0M56_04595 [Kaistella sp.]|nr:hypothetical protein [Kaistella sp.]